LLALNTLANTLKGVPRTGWLDRGVEPLATESVADHSLGVALLAWACAIERQAQGAAIDPNRVLALAVLHDLAEAEAGDQPPYDVAAIPGADDVEGRRDFLERRHLPDPERRAAKVAAEDATIGRMRSALPAASEGMIGELWAELRDGTSAEARFVKQVDRLETFLQSRRYAQANPGLPIDSFRLEVLETIDDPLLAAIRDAALAGE